MLSPAHCPYDTYGFSTDLTTLMAEERGLSIDMKSYEVAKEKSYILSQGKAGEQAYVINIDVQCVCHFLATKQRYPTKFRILTGRGFVPCIS